MNNPWIEQPISPTPPKQSPPKQDKILLRTAGQTFIDAQSLPPIEPLIDGIWNVGGFAILAGDTGAGKSLFAVFEAFRIAKDRTALYFDFELSDRQFERRYKNADIPENFIYGKFDPKSLDYDFGFDDIAAAVEKTGADCVIIDNVTALSLRSTVDADAAIQVCRGLKELQIKNHLSILVLAHVPKIAPGTPLNVNHLAGSKNLANFADTITFIGKSCDGASIRYVKTVKNRDAEAPGVWAFQIVDPGGNLHYKYLGHCQESDHLAPNPNEVLKAEAIQKRTDGKSLRQIEKELFFEKGTKVSHQTIKHWTGAPAPVNGHNLLIDEPETPY